jgi:hypothetical protein
MVSSSSVIYKIGDDEIYSEDTEANIDDTSSEVLVTIQNNIVDLHNVSCYLLLALGMLIGVGVIRCLNR